MSDERSQLKRMADSLKSGATMLPEHCPACNSPLFKIRDEVWCLKCNKRVVIVKEGEPEPNLVGLGILSNVEDIILTKLRENSEQVKNEKDPDKLRELASLISLWL